VRLRSGNQPGISQSASLKKRGPKPKVRPSEVLGRAENYRGFLDNMWDRFWPKCSAAQTEEEVITAFREAYSGFSDIVPARALMILRVKSERTFPKRRAARINFMADSLAGQEVVTARRSRDICAQERLVKKRAHRILRYEYFIECSCGYQGHSQHHACPDCGTKIEFPPNLGSSLL
jgi:lipopolysaccharide biosynthesis regulator YciM